MRRLRRTPSPSTAAPTYPSTTTTKTGYPTSSTSTAEPTYHSTTTTKTEYTTSSTSTAEPTYHSTTTTKTGYPTTSKVAPSFYQLHYIHDLNDVKGRSSLLHQQHFKGQPDLCNEHDIKSCTDLFHDNGGARLYYFDRLHDHRRDNHSMPLRPWPIAPLRAST